MNDYPGRGPHRPRRKYKHRRYGRRRHYWHGERPPWAHRGKRPYPDQWPQHPERIFFRLLMFFGFLALFVVGGMGALAFVFTRLLDGAGHTAVLVWLMGCSLSLAFPILAVTLGVGAFRRIAQPLGEVMAAADAVAEGDFSVRVAEQKRSEFNKLAKSFNRMTTQLEISDEQRRNLTADVAHELRTPLHIIQGNLEGVLDGVYEPTAEHIQDTLEETQLLARLVEDLRTLSLAESGHLPLHMELLDVNELLDDLQTSFSGQAESADVVLTVVGEKRPLTIQGDADRLNQAFSNIIINAIHHTPAGGTIEVTTNTDDQLVTVSVRDSGIGISAEKLPFVFDRFWKADKSRSGSGTGLGLAITRQLIVAHGGHVSVESEVGAGATFVVALPRLLDDESVEDDA